MQSTGLELPTSSPGILEVGSCEESNSAIKVNEESMNSIQCDNMYNFTITTSALIYALGAASGVHAEIFGFVLYDRIINNHQERR